MFDIQSSVAANGHTGEGGWVKSSEAKTATSIFTVTLIDGMTYSEHHFE